MTNRRQRRRAPQPEEEQEELRFLPFIIDITEGEGSGDPPVPPGGPTGPETPGPSGRRPSRLSIVIRLIEAVTWLLIISGSWVAAFMGKSPWWVAILTTTVFSVIAAVRALGLRYIVVSNRGVKISRRRL